MIGIQTQPAEEEQLPSTPIISNRSPRKRLSEKIGGLPLPFPRNDADCEHASDSNSHSNSNSNSNSSSVAARELHETSASEQSPQGGSRNGRWVCDASGSDSSSTTPSDRAPRFSCPDEEPIVVPRSAIAPYRTRLSPKNNESSRGVEERGKDGGGSNRNRNRNRRRRPLLSLSSWKFSLLFPAANNNDPSKISIGSVFNTIVGTSKGKRRSNSNSKSNSKSNNDENGNDSILKHNNRTLEGLADVHLFFALIFEFFRSGMPMKLVRQIGSTDPSWFLPGTFHDNRKNQSRFPSQSLLVSHGRRLQLQRQRRRRSAQKRRERPVRISGLPNQGQTCFLNSVLQSLASLEPFLEYLEGIVQFQEEMDHVSSSASLVSESSDGTRDGYGRLLFSNHSRASGNSSTRDPTFTKQLLDLIKGINDSEGGSEEDENENENENETDDKLLIEGEHRLVPTGFQAFWGQSIGFRRGRRRRKRPDPKTLLRRIAKSNQQFSSYGMYEQQDAQELFASLMEVVIHDSELDESPSDRRLEAVSDDGDEHIILSLCDLLVQIGNEKDMVAAESNGENLSLTMANKPGDMQTEHSTSFPEEKKQDHNERTGIATTIATSPHGEETKGHGQTRQSRTSNGIATSYPQSNPSDGTKTMRSIMSPITPSPLSGWLGSTLRCSKCKHVRPIQNAPFLDIPLVPTSVPNYLSKAYGYPVKPVAPNASPMPSCSLDQCLENFTSVERVQDVECRSCTIQEEIANLEEEAMMLRGAVETTERRISKKIGDTNMRTAEPEPLEQTKYLRDDLLKVEKRLFRLKTMDPDEDDAEASIASLARHDDSTFLLDSSEQDEKMLLQRCEAKKCLLLTRSPSILCCHVQRRYYDPFTNRMEKCVQFVEFPLFLDLSPYCAYGQKAIIPWVAGSRKEGDVETIRQQSRWNNDNNRSGRMPYRLQSVIEHRGNAYGGHYVAYRRDHSGTWFCVSDSRVTPVSWRDVQTCQAYMLFYEAM